MFNPKKMTFESLILVTIVVAAATAFFIGSVMPVGDIKMVVENPMALFALLAVVFSLAKMVSLVKLKKEDWVSFASIFIGMGIIIYIAGPQLTVFSTLSTKYLGIYSSDELVAQVMGTILALTGFYAVLKNDVFGLRRFGVGNPKIPNIK